MKDKTSRHKQEESNKKPSILLVTNRMNAGGAETHILSLASALMQAGCFVAVASGGGIFESELKNRGILHIEAPLYSKMPHNIIRSALILRRAVKRYGFTILHAHSRVAALACRMITKGGLFATLCRDNLRFVTTTHLDFHITPLTRHFSYWGERSLAVSEDLREYLIKGYGLSYEQIDLTVNGIDTARFNKHETPKAITDNPQKTFEIVHISRIDKDRAMTAYLLLAIMPTLLKKHRVHLTIVGSGELFYELSLRAERLKLVYGDCIELVGEKDDVLPYLKHADIAIGVSRAALEAMSCRLPCILSGNDGYLGIFEKKKLDRAARTNFCCRGESKPCEKFLQRDIETLLNADAERRQTLGNEGRAVVEEYYSIEKMTHDYLKFYEKLRPYKRKKYNRHLILGYHGYRNAGDDALLGKIIEGIRQEDRSRGITVLSYSPSLTEKTFPVRAVGRYRPFAVIRALLAAEVLYVGGGTLLQTKTSRRSLFYYLTVIRMAKLFGKTVVYWANGIGNLPPKTQLKVAKTLSSKSIISLRDEVSYYKTVAMLGKIPNKKHLFWQENKRTRYVIETADSAATLLPCTRYHVEQMLGKYNGEKYFVIATNGCASKRDTKRYEKRIATAVSLAAEKGLFPVFLLMHPKKDVAITKRIAAHLKLQGYHSLVLSPTPREAMGLISLAEFVISSRYHPLLFASVLGTRAICYSNDEKCLEFSKAAFGEEALCRFDKNDAHRLTEAILSMLIVKTLPSQVMLFAPNPLYADRLKTKAQGTAERINAALLKLALESKKKSSFVRPDTTAKTIEG